MIYIQPYIDKLEALKEYMFMKIDGKGKALWINLDAMESFTPKELFDIWNETGWLLSSTKRDPFLSPPRELTFEEYYQEKSNQININSYG
jgi:hypothetical protein